MDKSPEAFRTISEVAEALDTPAHVLRFWESRFPQIRPVKRAGGRRYYRPADVALLSGIRHLLHDQGMTIRGVQKVLREQGVRHVAALAPDHALTEDDADDEAFTAALAALRGQHDPEGQPEAPDDSGRIVDLARPATPRPPPVPREGGADVLRLHKPQAPAAGDRDPAPGPAALPPDVLRTTTLHEATDASLPDDAAAGEDKDVPEARHIWVEDEPELALGAPPAGTPGPGAAAIPLPRRVAPAPSGAARGPNPAPATMFDDIFAGIAAPGDAPAKLSGLAARIRALPQPLSPEAMLELTELHNRLGLLHAQIAEALNNGR